ncbi:SPOR domain-containing protein [uncultured Roseibium sp.]|uniref:SPOR domain-containing protein n=1 Tax=uncultured Roseibium sp. TaxID=1936171 RepID=UPI003749A968
MSRDSDHPKTDLPQTSADASSAGSTPMEDPLVELARIVHRNKQTASAAVEAPPVKAPVPDEPANQRQSVQETYPVTQSPYVYSESKVSDVEPAEDAAGVADQQMPGFDVNETIASQTMQYPAAGDMSTYSLSGSTVMTDEPVEAEIPQSRLHETVSKNLEDNLTAELEDELIGAFRQSFTPAGVSAARSQPDTVEPSPAEDYEYETETATAYDTEPEERAPEHSASSAYSEPVAEQERGWHQARSGNLGHLGVSAYRQPANDRSPPPDDDLFAGLDTLEAEIRGTRTTAPSEPEPSGLDTLFADLEFSPERETRSEPEVQIEPDFRTEPEFRPEAELPREPELRSEAVLRPEEVLRNEPDFTALDFEDQQDPQYREPVKSDDIDEMVWPDAANSIPVDENDETPPPPEGYDLDAVARAMQESDPSLDGTGVLPPHPRKERLAAPGHERNSRKGLYTAAGVVAVALLGGVAFLMFDGSSVDVPSGPPPVIAGLQEPLKIYPDNKEAPAENSASKLIYDRVGTAEGQTNERLVLPEETKPAELPPAPEGTAASDPLVPGGPKKVRTLVVRPDGTIISGEPDAAPVRTVETTPVRPTAETPAPAPAPATPVTGTPSPAAPAAATPEPTQPETPQIVASTDTETGTPDAEATGPVTTVVPRKKPEVPVQVATTSQPAPQTTAPAQQNAPLNLNSPAPAAPQAAAPVASTAGRIAPGTYVVQVTSQRSEDAARSAYQALQQRYPSILGSKQAVIVSANIEDRGTFYRARIPSGSRDEAISLCESLKSAGGDCFVRRN